MYEAGNRIRSCLADFRRRVFPYAGAESADAESAGRLFLRRDGRRTLLWWEELRFRLVLRELDAHDLNSVISIGDIFWRPCSDEMYRRTRDQFNGLRHPVVYTPGDNEWFDCWEPPRVASCPRSASSGFERFFSVRRRRALAGRRMALVSQPDLVENVHWTNNAVVFATVHLIGSANGMRPFPARTAVDDTAARRRTEAAAIGFAKPSARRRLPALPPL